MFARMVLPLLGGSPAVWNTTQVFFQAALLAGYGYAHLATRLLGARRQAGLHLVLLLLPLVLLPLHIPVGWKPPTDSSPVPWLLLLLAVAVGLPFFIVSASSPLLQQWFTATGHRSAADPYFLYAASNLGSMLALVSYPLLIEPYLGLAAQSWMWAAGYLLLIGCMLACCLALWRAPRRNAKADTLIEPAQPLMFARRVRWVLLAFVPSSLMLSVTTYLSTDIAAIPLLWVIPLAIYLLSFTLVFASRPLMPLWLTTRAMPIVLLPLVIALAAQANQPIALLIPLHLLTFFCIAMVCHGQIAADRPDARHLTEFYMWMSFGGVLGGIFNALVAPLIFTSVAEYPLMLVLASLLLTRPAADAKRSRQQTLDWALPLILLALTASLVVVFQYFHQTTGPILLAVIFGIPALLCFSFSRRPIRFGLGVGAILLAATLHTASQGQVLYAERSFFGINRVLVDPTETHHLLVHGSTLHGIQSLEPAHSREPLAYYHSSGPLGQVFDALPQPQAQRSVTVVGLGAGSTACYHQPGQHWTFYEIDPNVERIARDPRLFTFMRDCAPDATVILGDARLSLASAAPGAYDLMLFDAYSSDAIPIHLITREALRLYLDKLAPNGMLAFHISNRHLDLQPVLGDLARDAGLATLTRDDNEVGSATTGNADKWASEWVVLARTPAALGSLTHDARWQATRTSASKAVWTDSFSSLLSVFHW